MSERQKAAEERLRFATADLVLTEQERHIFVWLEMWEPETLDAITAVIEKARAQEPRAKACSEHFPATAEHCGADCWCRSAQDPYQES